MEQFPDDPAERVGDESVLNRLPTKVIILVIVAAGIGGIGVFTGFATLLGTLATAAGDTADLDYGATLTTAGIAFLLGVGLWVSAYLMWRGARSAHVVLGIFTFALVLSTAWQMISDSLSFITVISTVMATVAIAFTFYLLLSPEVREHVRR